MPVRAVARVENLRVVLLLMTLGGCVTPSTSTSAPDDPRCDEAIAHLQVCGQDTEIVFVDGCDPAMADEILAVECETFDDPGKADLIQDLLCRMGFLHGCDVPQCEEALPPDFHDWGQCSDLIDQEGCGACDYYRCREETSVGMCGDAGYYLGFGYQYCVRYRQLTEPRLSPAGQIWSAQARRCLMETLGDAVPDSTDCGGLVEAGYDSHPGCYLGTGFCELPTSDWLKIAHTVDPADVDFALMLEIASDCSD